MSQNNKIAVIGMAGRFPGAKNIDQYWENLISGKETISRFTDEELRNHEFLYEELKNNPNFVPARGIINDIDKFDADFFGFTPKDAKYSDPQHRVWLETVWEAFENAGCDPYSYEKAIGVFGGGYVNTYLLNNILRDKRKYENFIRLRTTESFQLMTLNDIGYLPTKTAYIFDLKGPAMNIQTACSTSLVAIAQACNSLYSFESDMCIAGGVCILTPQESGYIHQEGAIPSPDGHCRPFDTEAAGTVFSNGVGVVVLKRLNDAIEDRDNIIAVVDGWAINNDGNKKVSFTAPSVDGQIEVISMAQSFADVKADDISYIEAHGTGTHLGDPIEISALSQAFARTSSKKQFCGVGSVKSNIGHADAAAGVASFIKLCLIAKNKQIPPSLHYKEPNPFIKFENSPFYVVDKLTDCHESDKLIMGVSAFGIGGTNAHIIVEEAPVLDKKDLNVSESEKTYILPFSAKSKASLQQRKEQIIEYIGKNPDTNLDDLAYTLWKGRNHMTYRATCNVSLTKQLLDSEIDFQNNILDDTLNKITFMFPGQGAQYFRMGHVLYHENLDFKEIVDIGFNLFYKITQIDLKAILFDHPDKLIAEQKLAETSLTQPALFIIEYALAKLLIKQGVQPDNMIGHSIGEYTAACIAGVFDFETGLHLVIKRGQLMQKMPKGEMFAVFTSKDNLEEINNGLYEIAAYNTPEGLTISFDSESLDEVSKLLERNNILFIPLNTSHAFHSHAFDPMLEEFEQYVNQFDLKAPQIPVISCLTGDFLTNEQATSGIYWASQLRNLVLFYPGLKSILSKSHSMFIEVGPNTHLSGMFRKIPEISNKKSAVITFDKPEVKSKFVLESILGSIWTLYKKYTPALDFINEDSSKIALPTYPYNRERYWVDYQIQHGDQIEERASIVSPIEKDRAGLNIEVIILEIWKENLGLKNINLSDNFFTIGGTSLLAITVVEQIKQELAVEFELKQFFNAPSIAEICTYIKMSSADFPDDLDNNKMQREIIQGEVVLF